MFVFELSVFAGAVTGSAGGLGPVRGGCLGPEEACAGAVSLAAWRAAACGRLMQMYTGGGCGVALFVVALLGPESIRASQRLRRFIPISSIDQGRLGFRNLA